MNMNGRTITVATKRTIKRTALQAVEAQASLLQHLATNRISPPIHRLELYTKLNNTIEHRTIIWPLTVPNLRIWTTEARSNHTTIYLTEVSPLLLSPMLL